MCICVSVCLCVCVCVCVYIYFSVVTVLNFQYSVPIQVKIHGSRYQSKTTRFIFESSFAASYLQILVHIVI